MEEVGEAVEDVGDPLIFVRCLGWRVMMEEVREEVEGSGSCWMTGMERVSGVVNVEGLVQEEEEEEQEG